MHESFDGNGSFDNDEMIKDDFNLVVHEQTTPCPDKNRRRSMSNYDKSSFKKSN